MNKVSIQDGVLESFWRHCMDATELTTFRLSSATGCALTAATTLSGTRLFCDSRHLKVARCTFLGAYNRRAVTVRRPWSFEAVEGEPGRESPDLMVAISVSRRASY